MNVATATVQVTVWTWSLDRLPDRVEQLAGALSPDEHARAARFRFTRDRDRYVVGRAGMRGLLGEMLGVPPGRVEFRYGAHGKPELAGPDTDGWRFNLAHSDATAVLAITRGVAVGVDVERRRTVADRAHVAAAFFSTPELLGLRQLPDAERDDGFLRCWTRKEAYLKAAGIGLAAPLRGFAVPLDAELSAGTLLWAASPAETERWLLADVSHVAPGHVAALALHIDPRTTVELTARAVEDERRTHA